MRKPASFGGIVLAPWHRIARSILTLRIDLEQGIRTAFLPS